MRVNEILGYIIAAIVIIAVLSIVLALLKVAVGILFYVFIGMVILSGITFLYNKVAKK